jgi:hypothetical protein
MNECAMKCSISVCAVIGPLAFARGQMTVSSLLRVSKQTLLVMILYSGSTLIYATEYVIGTGIHDM